MPFEGSPTRAPTSFVGTPKPKSAHDCLDALDEDKGDCTINGAVVVIQEGNKVEKVILDGVERVKAIDRAHREANGETEWLKLPTADEVRAGVQGDMTKEQFEMALSGGLIVFVVLVVVGFYSLARGHIRLLK